MVQFSIGSQLCINVGKGNNAESLRSQKAYEVVSQLPDFTQKTKNNREF